MVAVTICSDFEAPQNKVSHCFHCFPIYLPLIMGLYVMIFVLWMLSFKPAFSLSSFTFIKRLFSSSSLSAIRVVSAHLRSLIFLLAILIPTFASSRLAFHMGKQWRQAFIFLGSKITADSDCNHEIKKCLLLGRKVVTNLDSILTASKHVYYL